MNVLREKNISPYYYYLKKFVVEFYSLKFSGLCDLWLPVCVKRAQMHLVAPRRFTGFVGSGAMLSSSSG